MANISGTYDEHAETQTSFDPIPVGDYRAAIIEAEIEEISKRDDKGRCLKLTWKIETGLYDGRLIWQRLNIWGKNMNNLDKVVQIANSQFASIRQATGVVAPQDTDELLHIPCTVKVGIRTDPNGQYDPQNEIKSVKSAGGSAPAQQQGARSAPPVTNAAVAAQQQQKANTGGAGKMPWN